jgi:hypothetical protein
MMTLSAVAGMAERPDLLPSSSTQRSQVDFMRATEGGCVIIGMGLFVFWDEALGMRPQVR